HTPPPPGPPLPSPSPPRPTSASKPPFPALTPRATPPTPSCPRSLWHHRTARRRVSPPSSRCWFRFPMTDELPIVLLHGSATGSYSWAAVRMRSEEHTSELQSR